MPTITTTARTAPTVPSDPLVAAVGLAHDQQPGDARRQRRAPVGQRGALELQPAVRALVTHSSATRAKVTTATSEQAERHDREQAGGRQRISAPHGALHAEPAQVAAGAEHGAAADGEQGEQRPPTRHVERVDELAHGDPAGEQAERRADPGQERPLVGQREAVVGLGALLEVDLPPPGHDS